MICNADHESLMLDEVDKKLLNILQDLPIAQDIWQFAAAKLGLGKEEVLRRVEKLYQAGYIEGFKTFVDPEKFGLRATTLLALDVPTERLEEAERVLKTLPGIGHVFKRMHEYNLWITISACDDCELEELIQRAIEISGAKRYLNFPTKKRYKLSTKIELE